MLIGNYARNFGIELMMYGHTAHTNGKQITIPRMDLSDSEGMNVAFGYVGHESGHICYSDFDVIKSLNQHSTLFGLLNAMEDARIERLMVWNWPGMEKTFDGVLKSLRKDLFETFRQAAQGKDLATLLVLYCNARAHEEWTSSPTLRGVRRAAQTALRSLLPASVIEAVNRIIKGVSYKKDTGEVLDTAETVFSFVQRYIRRSNEEHDREQQSRQDQADSGSGSGSQEPDLFANQPLPPGSAQARNRKKPNFNRMMKDFDFSSELTNALEDDFNPSERLVFSAKYNPDAIPTAADEMERRSYSTPGTHDFGGVGTGDPRPGDKGELYQKVIRSGFRIQVTDLMRSYDEWMNGCRDSGREVDVRAYANRVINGFKVFRAKKLRKSVNTSVEILIDASGSMAATCLMEGGDLKRFQVANETALGLAMGMEGIRNLDREVIYFPGTYAEFDDVCLKEQTVKSRGRYFAQLPHSCTPLTQALLHAVERLPEKSPYQRNIIVVVTDGKPDCSETAEKVIRRCTELGVEIYAIGIGDGAEMAVGNLPYLATETVTDASQLQAAMKKLIKRSFFRREACASTSVAKLAAARMSAL